LSYQKTGVSMTSSHPPLASTWSHLSSYPKWLWLDWWIFLRVVWFGGLNTNWLHFHEEILSNMHILNL